VWDGERWMGGNRAVDHCLDVRGDDPSLIPAEALAPRARPAKARAAKARPAPGRTSGRGPGVTPAAEVSGLIRDYLAGLPTGLGEGEHRDDHGYKFAALLVRDLELEDADALAWLKEWDARNAVKKGEARLRELIANAHLYGRHGYGSGLGAPPAAPVRRHHRNKPGHSTVSCTLEIW
jgi:hypothetical protein